MTEDNKLKLKTLYYEITEVWKCLCENHSLLLEKTFDEYKCLLNSEIEKLETVIEGKEKIVQNISVIENQRSELIEQIANCLGEKIKHFDDLIFFINQEIQEERTQKHLSRFNSLLIDIIEKIQSQNKRNQLFLNKALLSLRTIRNEFSGQTNYQTYTQKGERVTNTKI